MKNFIFKSEADFHKIVFNKLEALLVKQRHQRRDLAEINRFLQVEHRNRLHDQNLQSQVDEYFEDDEKETSPQTDQSTKADLD